MNGLLISRWFRVLLVASLVVSFEPGCGDGGSGEPDFDKDGLSDAYEATLGTDPADPDTDDDGFLDSQEVLASQTDPTLWDTDGDSFGDWNETKLGMDPLTPDAVLAEDSVVIENVPELKLLEVGEDTLTFQVEGEGGPPVRSGDILVSTGKGGYLRRVTSVTVEEPLALTPKGLKGSGGSVKLVLKTASVALSKAYRELHIDTSKQLQMNWSVPLSGVDLYADDVFSVNVSGKVVFTPTVEVVIDIVDHETLAFSLIATGALSFSVDAQANALAPFGQESFEKTLLASVYPLPTPVPVTVNFSLKAGVAVDIPAAIGVRTGFDSTTTVQAGVELDPDSGKWVYLSDVDLTAQEHGFKWVSDVSEMSLRLFLRPKLAVKVGGIVGPFVAVEPYLQGVASPADCNARLIAGIDARVGGEISVLGWRGWEIKKIFEGPSYVLEEYDLRGILCPGGPNLLVSYCRALTPEAFQGATWDPMLEYEIQNVGDVDSGGFRAWWLLSTDHRINTSDYLLADAAFVSLPPGGTTGRLPKALTLPPENDPFWEGCGKAYYLGLIVDPDDKVEESDESNNSNRGDGLDTTSVRVICPRRADLHGARFEMAIPAVVAGEPYDPMVYYEIRNSGDKDSGTFRLAWILSRDSNISRTEDVELANAGVVNVRAGSSTGLLPKTLTLPEPGDPFWRGDGTYYLGMIIDSTNVVVESDETNNSNLGNGRDRVSVRVTETDVTDRADLVGQFFRVVPEVAYSGTAYDPLVEYEIRNLGEADSGMFQAQFFVSVNNAIGHSDKLLATVGFTGIPAGGSTGRLPKRLTLPEPSEGFWVGSRTYYIGMVLDTGGHVAESDENNNANTGDTRDRAPVRIEVTALPPAGPDLSAEDFRVLPDSASAGDAFDPMVELDIRNTGATDSGVFRVRFYLSRDGIISSEDKLLADPAFVGVKAGDSTGPVPKSLTLPDPGDEFWSGDGRYYIGVIVDAGRHVLESNEGNNSNRGEGIDMDFLHVTGTAR